MAAKTFIAINLLPVMTVMAMKVLTAGTAVTMITHLTTVQSNVAFDRTFELTLLEAWSSSI